MHMPSLGGAPDCSTPSRSAPVSCAARSSRELLDVDVQPTGCARSPTSAGGRQAYRNDRIVIGAPTPEFSFEHEMDGVRRATRERAIDYPVVADNDYPICT